MTFASWINPFHWNDTPDFQSGQLSGASSSFPQRELKGA